MTRSTTRPGADALAPLAHPYLLFGLGVIGYAAALGLGFLVTGNTAVTTAETAVVQRFAGISAAFADGMSAVVAELFGAPWALLVILAFMGILWWATRDVLRALTGGGIATVCWLSSAVLKALVSRPRPIVDVASGIHISAEEFSYPSGHVSLAVGLVVAVVFTVRVAERHGRALTLTLVIGGLGVVIVMITRLHLGMHFPTDLLGALVGATAAGLMIMVIWLNVVLPFARGGLAEKSWWQRIDSGCREPEPVEPPAGPRRTGVPAPTAPAAPAPAPGSADAPDAPAAPPVPRTRREARGR